MTNRQLPFDLPGRNAMGAGDFVTSASNGNRRLVGVVLGADSANARTQEMITLFDRHLGTKVSQ